MLINIIQIITIMQIKIISKNKTNKHVFFYFFRPDKEWPWSCVSLSMIENQVYVVLILKLVSYDCWYFFFGFFENFI